MIFCNLAVILSITNTHITMQIKQKTFVLLLAFLLPIMGFAQGPSAPVSLYMSKQSGQTTIFSGNGSKTTDKHENGSVTVVKNGPLIYNVTPNEFSIGTNQSKTWDGKVWVDVPAGPAPGTSANASITGSYTVTYSRPNPNMPTGHELVTNKVGSYTVDFVIYSLNVESVDSVPLCPGATIQLPATGYPEGGTYTWTAGAGLQITGGGNTNEVSVKDVGGTPSTLSVKYSVQGVTYTKTIKVNVNNKPLTITGLPDTLFLIQGELKSLTPQGNPKGGSYKWEVAGPVALQSGPFNYVAFLKAAQVPGIGSATCTYTLCGKSVAKSVVVKVKDCRLDAPTEIWVVKNKTATITAYGQPNGGTYVWSAVGGDNAPSFYQIQGAPNAATVTIKGMQKGDQAISVTFNTPGCNETKTVMVHVLDQLTLTLSPATINGFICKGFPISETATGLPTGGSYSWTVGGPLKMNSASNTPYAFMEPTGGGNCTATCTYTLNGESVTKSVTFKSREIMSVTLEANPNAEIVNSGTTVNYVAKALDQDGNDVTADINFKWEQVYRPIGAANNPSTWQTIPLSGGGSTQSIKWNASWTGAVEPAPGTLMEGWVQAVVWNCNIRIGSKWIKVKK